MSCESIRKQLTAYLDGELEGERGSIVRGHLRGCDECRKIASDESLLRDGLRALPPMDPPASMWAGVQAKLAAAEVAHAAQPAWRRFFARLAPQAPQLGFASLAVAAAIIFFVVRARHEEAPAVAETTNIPPVVIAPDHQTPPTPPPIACGTASQASDVTDQIAAEPSQLTACYAQAAHELRELLPEARAKWTDDHKHEVDAKLLAFEKEVADAKDERARQKSYRAQIRYLQRAVIRDDVALASGGTP
ncbi:MAG TPA: zf-HC2 domain-containing protein [Kofleriaceae bacterium]|nr:zf-HC2 domain-containing protein [Kofleriaceae bacterium]